MSPPATCTRCGIDLDSGADCAVEAGWCLGSETEMEAEDTMDCSVCKAPGMCICEPMEDGGTYHVAGATFTLTKSSTVLYVAPEEDAPEEVARIKADGTVVVNWPAVERAAERAPDMTWRGWCRIALAIRDGTAVSA